MTTNEFLVLPDRERDAIVAEHVMGLTVIGGFQCRPVNSREEWSDILLYSTNIAAAWDALLTLGNCCIQFHAGDWVVFSGYHTDSEPLGWAKTAPLAICIAALRAAGFLKD